MKLLNSMGPNPRMVRMFMIEKGIELESLEHDVLAAENRKSPYTDKNPGGQMPALEFDDGGIELAEAVVDNITGEKPNINYMYGIEDSLENKIEVLAKGVYNAEGVHFNLASRRALREFSNNGWSRLPICMAKTHLSLSHNRSLKGLPSEYTFRVSDARASVGAGFIYPIAGNIMTMPGLPGSPRKLDVDDKGNILGL